MRISKRHLVLGGSAALLAWGAVAALRFSSLARFFPTVTAISPPMVRVQFRVDAPARESDRYAATLFALTSTGPKVFKAGAWNTTEARQGVELTFFPDELKSFGAKRLELSVFRCASTHNCNDPANRVRMEIEASEIPSARDHTIQLDPISIP